ncbi:MAG: NAD-dependent epimerase/dehydratase family protein [Thermodesulfobacteriota bacterium]
METVLITGGGGFLGKAIARRLVAEGKHVKSLSRRRYPALDRLDVEQIQADIADAKAVENACRGVDVVFHTAAKAGVWGSEDDFFRTNVIGTRNVVSGCLNHGVPVLVHTSSPSVVFNGRDMEGVDERVPYPDRYHAAYPRTKALAEREVLQSVRKGLSAVILRPHLIWGPEDNHLVPRILERAEKLAIIGSGRNRVDVLYIDNAVHAHVQAAEKLKENPFLSGRIYFISQGEPVHLWEMINRILEAGGKQPLKRSIPTSAAYVMAACMEAWYRLFGVESEPRLTRFVVRELATSHWFDISAARRDLGYVPEVSIEEGLNRLKQWLNTAPNL